MASIYKHVAYLAAVVPLFVASGTTALEIDLSYSGGFENRPAAMLAMEYAAANWEAVLSDPITIQIEISEVSIFDLPFGAQSATYPNWYEETYPTIRTALIADATSPDDLTLIGHLPDGPRVSFRTWDPGQNVVINDGDDHINNWILLPRANLKALGLPVDGGDVNADAEIQWSDFFLDQVFDFDRTDGIDGTDFVGVATHEIGHALGFSSGVDSVDVVFAGLVPVTPAEIVDYPIVTMLDLFRYSAESLPLIDLTPGGTPYFSLDGGGTSLATFATGENFGDGWQAGHWQVDQEQGIMDANLPDDAIHNFSALDLRAMDAIGWDLAAAGDFNHDGTIDELDYSLWTILFGSNVQLAADGNRNGIVDAADYVVWRDHVSSSLGGMAASAGVPEPTSAALGLLVLACLAGCGSVLARRREVSCVALPFIWSPAIIKP